MATTKPVGTTESKQIDELLKRPALYRNVDGTKELDMGIMGLGFLGMRFVYPLPADPALGGLCCLVLVGISLAIMHFGSKAIKRRWTYPRTGFAEPRCAKRGGMWMMLGSVVLGSAVFGAAVSLLALRRLSGGPTFVGLAGVVTAAIFAASVGVRAPWKQCVAAVFALGSLAIAFLPPDLLASLCQGPSFPAPFSPSLLGAFFLYGAWMGAVFLTSGLITLRLYIRGTRPAAPDSE